MKIPLLFVVLVLNYEYGGCYNVQSVSFPKEKREYHFRNIFREFYKNFSINMNGNLVFSLLSLHSL